MLEKMKWALSKLSVVAASWTPCEFKEALLSMAEKIDQQERRIAELEGRNHG